MQQDTRCLHAAVLGNESAVPPKNGSLYTEDDWNETSSIKNNEAYWLSKVSNPIHCLHSYAILSCYGDSNLCGLVDSNLVDMDFHIMHPVQGVSLHKPFAV